MGGSKINLDSLAYVHYSHQDLAKEEKFLKDFGLEEVERVDSRVYYRGTGPQPFVYVAEQSTDPQGKRFVAGGWLVQSIDDLERASSLPAASSIKDSKEPGGGKVVTLKDPNGVEIRLLYGQETLGEKSEPMTSINTPSEKQRKGEFVRMKTGPSHIHKLGHYGFMIPPADYKKTLSWYTSTFNLKVTDSVYNPETNEDLTCFLHIDKGQTYTDHHSFFLGHTPKSKAHVHHASFEVQHMDDQLLGHDWLTNKGWTNCWGVGRHVLGSQVFDYWFDAMGNILEHYADGDLVNEDTPWGREIESPESLYVWGPNIPLGFVTTEMNDANVPIPAPA
ncbi:Glyoxalase/Bleomycin resistance protein/Dihydroxybiphenyl dioxygenase [Rhizodiscina lignyota]|uniref:Glyoxalase/Bleomycin resistance protein/Dihydroxybiphenyl dioxygenase n=1 Tax=Rhizodiscina lignyota TaxID=1504668 RepID=A0A9P4IG69_9PEZI|nr:Glyoxalase/Bleomycin resistance protein/Dihydroxybiphenyl dioxygenase [Rhizodiscina lignyota]